MLKSLFKPYTMLKNNGLSFKLILIFKTKAHTVGSQNNGLGENVSWVPNKTFRFKMIKL